MSALPILYSFRRCPYAMRARLALKVSKVAYVHQEVSLKDKPEAMLKASSKGTVPVLVLSDGQVIDESLDIMFWALAQNDPENWLATDKNSSGENDLSLIHENDFDFKHWLDRYKYSDRFPEKSRDHYRHKGEAFISKLEAQLTEAEFLNGNLLTITDMAVAPFIRQFAHVDKQWFFKTQYTQVIRWLNVFLESERFQIIIKKNPDN